ncbi:MAG: hypothetical protein WA211_00420 [Candidatus Acidiferrales bacterium]
MPVCEGCGTRTDDAHIQKRAERIELALRQRPVDIRVLILDSAPPARSEDFFYLAAKDRATRSASARMYFDELVKAAGSLPGTALQEDSALADFRRRGFFLSYAVECPFESEGELHAALRRLAPTALKRVQYSLKPNYIVPISEPTKELIRLFGLIGWGDRLILDKAGPFVDPYLGDAQKQATFGTGFGERIKKALAALP